MSTKLGRSFISENDETIVRDYMNGDYYFELSVGDVKYRRLREQYQRAFDSFHNRIFAPSKDLMREEFLNE